MEAVNTTVTVSPPSGSAGTYHASITAVSMGVSVTDNFDIIVTAPPNRAPVLAAPANMPVVIGSSLSFDVTTTDADGDHVTLSASALPSGSHFTDHANGTGTFSWTPVAGQAGIWTASFTGTDGHGGSGSANTSVTVTDAPNHAPSLTAASTNRSTRRARLVHGDRLRPGRRQ
jgi:hypothetical protein